MTRLLGLVIFLMAGFLLADNARTPSYFLTLRYDDLDASISKLERTDFWAASEIIAQINAVSGEKALHEVPQPLDAFEIISWLELAQVGAVLVPAPLYVLLSRAGLLTNFRVAAFLPEAPAALVTTQTADFNCNDFSVQKYAFQKDDMIAFKNEYHNEGSLLSHELAEHNLSLAMADIYYFQDNDAQQAVFTDWTTQKNRVFGVFSADELPALKLQKDICVLDEHLTTPVSGYFLMANTVLKLTPEKIARIFDLANPKAYFGRFQKAVLAPQELKQRVLNLETYYQNRSPLPKLTYQNLRERMSNNIGTDYFSLILMGGGARSPYLFRLNNEFFKNVIAPQNIAQQAVLIGTSGGAVSALALSLMSPDKLLSDTSIVELTNLTSYISPYLRSKMLEIIIQHQFVCLALFMLIVLCFLWSIFHVFFTQKTASLIGKIGILAAITLGAWFVPEIPIEYALLFLVINFCGFTVTYFFLYRYKAGFVLNVMSNLIFMILLIGIVKFPFRAESLFRHFDTVLVMRNLMNMIEDKTCDGLSDAGEFSRCIYGKVRYPLVINAMAISAKTARRVNFFVRPAGSSFLFPTRMDWIDLGNCPEHLLDAVQGSAAIPMVFASTKFKCNSNSYELVDGSVESPMPLVQASELNIRYQFLFWNGSIDLDNGFMRRQKLDYDKNIIEGFIVYWLFKDQNLNRGVMQKAFQQTFFIAEPSMELISSIDFWGGSLENGQFVLPSVLPVLATQDFFSKPGIFSELSNGDPKPDEFWEHFMAQLER